MFGMVLHGTKLRNAMPFRTNNPAVAEPNTSDHSHTQRARGTGHGTERGKGVCIPLHSIQCALQQCFSPVLLSPRPFAFRICCLSRSCPSERVSSVSTTHRPSTCLRQQTNKKKTKQSFKFYLCIIYAYRGNGKGMWSDQEGYSTVAKGVVRLPGRIRYHKPALAESQRVCFTVGGTSFGLHGNGEGQFSHVSLPYDSAAAGRRHGTKLLQLD